MERLFIQIAGAVLVVESDAGRPRAWWQNHTKCQQVSSATAKWAVELQALVGAWSEGAIPDPKRIAAWLPKEPPFLAACWRAAIQIPRGETRTYAWLAAAAGRPTAHRAAAHAMARNPLSLLVPCHRVVGTNDIGGFCGFKPSTSHMQSSHWALTLKNRLLQIESGNQIENRKVLYTSAALEIGQSIKRKKR
ncbi:MAG: methylated-DNA--[protein]-cysteine S-methyltransferase [Planctomycetota bacterium]